jgi:hypothetical protein
MSTYTPPANPSPAHKAFLKFVAGIEAKDHAAIMACYDDEAEVKVQILPASLGSPQVSLTLFIIAAQNQNSVLVLDGQAHLF